MSSRGPALSGLAEALLTLAQGTQRAGPLLGDLSEEYRRFVLPERGRPRADLWFWGQVARSAWRSERSRSARTGMPEAGRLRSGRGTDMESAWQDIRFAARALLRRPGFALVAVTTLALGIGLNVTMYGAVQQVLLTPLPLEQPDELIMVFERRPAMGRERNAVSFPDFADWREQNGVFEAMAAYTYTPANLTGSDEPLQVRAVYTTWELFRVTGLQPLAGRVFVEEDGRPQAAEVVILGEGLWRSRFGGDPEVVGTSVQLDGRAHAVVGVVPDRGATPSWAQLWVPLTQDPTEYSRAGHFLTVLARLRDDVTLEGARAEMDAISLRLEAEYPDANEGHYANVLPFREEVVGGARAPLLVLMAAVGFVLLIVCANLGSMQLVRAVDRTREMAVRSALGAGKGRLVRQLLTESALLALVGGGLGLFLSLWGLQLVSLSELVRVSWVEAPGLDGGVLGFTLGAATLCVVLTGLAPALRVARGDLAASLREGPRGGEGRGAGATRRLLVGAEVALTVLLVVGAGLTLRSLVRLSDVDPGFRAEGVLTADLRLARGSYPEPADRGRFTARLLDRLRSVPGVRAAGATMLLPLGGGDGSRFFTILGRPEPPSREEWNARLRVASPGYFRAMGIPLLEGRDFQESDGPDSEPVVVVSEAMARRFWPGGSPLGGRLRAAWQGADTFTVVGVVGDVRHGGLEQESLPEMYFNAVERPPEFFTVVLRTEGDPEAFVPALRAEVRALDPDQPLAELGTMVDRVGRSLSQPRALSVAIGAFAGFAALLALMGIYGVVAFAVTRRRMEIGIRMALGAGGREVQRMVLRQGMTPVAGGLVLGLGGAAVLGRTLEGLLYQVAGTDPVTYAGAVLLLGSAALLACWIPARRAVRVDPVSSLRAD